VATSNRRVIRDPDIKRLTDELRLKVQVTRDLVDEINATAVALDVFRQLKRHRMVEELRRDHVI
jgi:hypothetical protein